GSPAAWTSMGFTSSEAYGFGGSTCETSTGTTARSVPPQPTSTEKASRKAKADFVMRSAEEGDAVRGGGPGRGEADDVRAGAEAVGAQRGAVAARRLRPVHEHGHAAAEEVEHLQPHVRRRGERVGDGRGLGEGVGEGGVEREGERRGGPTLVVHVVERGIGRGHVHVRVDARLTGFEEDRGAGPGELQLAAREELVPG